MQSKKTNRVDRYLRKGVNALGWATGAFIAGVLVVGGVLAVLMVALGTFLCGRIIRVGVILVAVLVVLYLLGYIEPGQVASLPATVRGMW